MGEIEKKRFREPSEYYWQFLFHSLFFGMSLMGLYFAFSQSEEEIYNYLDEKPSGNSVLRLGKLVLRILVMYLGKTGFIIGLSFCFIVIAYKFNKEIAEYLRYKKKCRLYHEGLIKNFYDIYDDYVPLLSLRKIKILFPPEEKTYKKKYPSKRKMKKQIKELEKQGK